ncbi:unnamed protein product [Natator depressus]
MEGETPKIPIRSSVKQGSPLSPTVFNLAMEPHIRVISSGLDCLDLYGNRMNILAYAEDLVLIADSPESLQQMLNVTSQATNSMGFHFNARKCASLHINGSRRDLVQATPF